MGAQSATNNTTRPHERHHGQAEEVVKRTTGTQEERSSSLTVHMPVLQPRERRDRQTRQEGWCWPARLPNLRPEVPVRSQQISPQRWMSTANGSTQQMPSR